MSGADSGATRLEFNVFEDAAIRANLEHDLQSVPSLTVFGPDDNAFSSVFSQFPTAAAKFLTADVNLWGSLIREVSDDASDVRSAVLTWRLCSQVLLYHVLPFPIFSADLPSDPGSVRPYRAQCRPGADDGCDPVSTRGDHHEVERFAFVVWPQRGGAGVSQRCACLLRVA
eukprot:1386983-Rhodomonas_salina.3